MTQMGDETADYVAVIHFEIARLMEYVAEAGIYTDRDGPLFRSLERDSSSISTRNQDKANTEQQAEQRHVYSSPDWQDKQHPTWFEIEFLNSVAHSSDHKNRCDGDGESGDPSGPTVSQPPELAAEQGGQNRGVCEDDNRNRQHRPE